jgi:hypothetical protein
MTQALCIKCGAFKHRAFNECGSCGFRPVGECDLAYSLALTDHFLPLKTLREIGAAIPEHGRPSLPPDQEEQMLATIRDPSFQSILGLGATETRKGGTFVKRLFGR